MRKMCVLGLFAGGMAAGMTTMWLHIRHKNKTVTTEKIAASGECIADGISSPVQLYQTFSDGQPASRRNYASMYHPSDDEPEDDEDEEEETEPEDDFEIQREENSDARPEVIHPAAFGEESDYEQITLLYFADGVVCDEQIHKVEDLDALIGVESLRHFGEYEPDAIHVRNDATRCYYEVILDTRTYAEALKTVPHHRG